MCSFQAEVKNVRLSKTVLFPETKELFSDKKRIKQILTTLIANALKFTFEGSVCVKASLEALYNSNENEWE